MTRRKRVLLVAGGLFAAAWLYEGLTRIVAYTNDAYVRSDLVAVAPLVTGQIVAIHVADNQPVKRGDRLISIDPVPFQLALTEQQAEIDRAEAQLAVDRDDVNAAVDSYNGATADANFARETLQRTASLARTSDATQAQLEQANNAMARSQTVAAARQADIARSRALLAVHEAALAAARAAQATAQWQLARTEIVAPVDGTINNLNLQPGDMARADQALIGIVDAKTWRIIANYKQSYLPLFHIGDTAWVWLDSHPWHFHRARIAGIARGISRSENEAALLPYVAPTTDWIRLQHRFPVTITLIDPPPDLTLYMGADARTVIFP
ncbi:MAG: HlyD family secretion protein [Acetobacteraceae bacterium]